MIGFTTVSRCSSWGPKWTINLSFFWISLVAMAQKWRYGQNDMAKDPLIWFFRSQIGYRKEIEKSSTFSVEGSILIRNPVKFPPCPTVFSFFLDASSHPEQLTIVQGSAWEKLREKKTQMGGLLGQWAVVTHWFPTVLRYWLPINYETTVNAIVNQCCLVDFSTYSTSGRYQLSQFTEINELHGSWAV